MQVSTRRAVAHPKLDLFRAIECAREARFDEFHTNRRPLPHASTAQHAHTTGLGA